MRVIEQFTGRQAGPLVQFVKYAIGGAVATGVHIVMFSLMAWLVLPCLSPRELVVKLFGLPVAEISDAVRASRAAVGNLVAFVFSNLTAYAINILWVFHRGRHHWALEILFFYAVSGLSMALGTGLQTLLIRYYGLTTEIAFGANLVTALLINYAMRKFLIFKG